MKKQWLRITSVLLVISMVLVFTPISVSAGSIVYDDDPLYQDGIYRFKNKATGKYLAISSTSNNDAISATTKTGNANDTTQCFRFHVDRNGGHSLHPLHSLNGYGRVLDIKRGGNPLQTGQKVQTFRRKDPTEDHSQLWYFYVGSASDLTVIRPKHNTNLALTASGSSVTIETYTGSQSQEWIMEYEGIATPPPVVKGQSAINSNSYFASTNTNKKYWNHDPSASSHSSNGTTASPCSHEHTDDNCTYSGSCGCNSFESSIQCLGYVKKINALAFGGNSYVTDGWTKIFNTNNDQNFLLGIDLKPGDVIELVKGSKDHILVVQSANANSITFTDCNRDAACYIQWGTNVSKTNITSIGIGYDRVSFVAIAPNTWSA